MVESSHDRSLSYGSHKSTENKNSDIKGLNPYADDTLFGIPQNGGFTGTGSKDAEKAHCKSAAAVSPERSQILMAFFKINTLI